MLQRPAGAAGGGGLSMGPERLDRFMARAIAAYYAGARPVGRDFTTAPEISQVFGECSASGRR